MRRGSSAAAVLTLLAALVAPSAARDELTEDPSEVREARLQPVSRLRRSAEAAASAVAGDYEKASRRLAELRSRLEGPVERLRKLRYGSLADLSEIDPERSRLRREVELGADDYDAELALLEAAKRPEFARRLSAIAAGGGLGAGTFGDLSAVARLEQAGAEHWEFSGRLRAALKYDEGFYAERAAELQAEGWRRRMRTAAAVGAAALCLLAAGVVWRVLRGGRPAPLAPGVVLGGTYRLDGAVEAGDGDGAWEGTDLSLRRRVRVQALGADDAALAAVRAAAGLRHPGILETYAVVRDAGRWVAVTEPPAGKTLRRHLQERGRLPFEEARVLVRRAAEALDFAHERGAVHGGLDARRVLVDAQGVVKLAGFGLGPGGGDPAADVSALGSILYEALTGSAPAPGELVAPSRLAPGLPPAADAVALRALRSGPGFATAGALAAALG